MKALHIVSWRLAAVVAVGFGLAAPLTGQRVPAPTDTDTVVHVLNRLGFGPRPGDIERVTQMGVDAYIEQQLHPERIVDPALAERLTQFPTISLTTAEIARDYYGPAEAIRRAAQQAAARQPQPAAMADDQMMMGQPARPAAANQQQSPELRAARQKEQQILQDLMQARVVRAVHSERQLEEMLTNFWFNHFNVFAGKGQVRVYLTEYERDAIRPHVLGSFRNMLGAVAESPAMLFYLDNFQNVDPKAAQRQADQQLARQRQAAGRGRGGMQRTQNQQQMEQQQQRMLQARNRGLNENYARELMELHTIGVDAGYTQDDVIAVARAFTGWTIDRPRDGGTFQFNAALHDNDPKVVLGTPIKGGGKKDGEAVLDLLASHPATATFIATKLARRFIADEPPTSVIDRAARVFLDSKGDLREVTRAIVTSPEFFSAEARRAKVKNPFEFVVSAIRVSGANVTLVQPLVQALQQVLGMPLYGAQPPTGWGDSAEDWVNTGALLGRLNFALQLSSGQLRGVRINVRALAPNTSAEVRDRVTAQLIAGGVSPITSETLAKAESPQHLVALALGSPEFQRK